ncbi:MAG: Fur family transcriptional regulator, partial [Streptosporangiaceae bacterium]
MVDAPARRDDAVVQELREAGLRVTMARQAILTWLTVHPHSTADAIADGMRGQFGLLRRIEPAGHPARFERRVGDNHHHLVCRGCGRTEDVDCVVGSGRAWN